MKAISVVGRVGQRSLVRIAIAALIGLAIVVLAAGSVRPTFDISPDQPDQIKPSQGMLVLHGDQEVLLKERRAKAKLIRPRASLRLDDSIKSESEKLPAEWYDGIWDDPRFMALVRQVV